MNDCLYATITDAHVPNALISTHTIPGLGAPISMSDLVGGKTIRPWARRSGRFNA